jgi:hypothetical protein
LNPGIISSLVLRNSRKHQVKISWEKYNNISNMTPSRNWISSLSFVTVDAVESQIWPIWYCVFFEVRFPRKRPSPNRVRRSEQRSSGPCRVNWFWDWNVNPEIVDEESLVVSWRLQKVFQLLKIKKEKKHVLIALLENVNQLYFYRFF